MFIFKVHNRIHKNPPPFHILTHSNPVHASPSHSLNISIFSTSMPRYTRLIFPSGTSPLNPECTSPVSYTCQIPCPSLFFWLHHPKNIWWTVHIMKLIIMKSSPVLIRPLLPRHPILKHPQPLFLLHRERPSFKFLQNKRQNYRSLHLNPYTIGQRTGRQKILLWKIANSPRLQSDLNFLTNGILMW